MAKMCRLLTQQHWQLELPLFIITLIAFTLNSATNTKTITTAMSIFPHNNSKNVPRINEWKVSSDDGTLTGIVTGHPILEDGDEITTSPLTNPDFAEGGEGTIVTTMSGTQYKLEMPKCNFNSNHEKPSLMGIFQHAEKTDPNSLRKTGTEPTIDHWMIDPTDGRLIGIVRGHPVLPDGDYISASPPVEENAKEGSIITTASGSRYELKTPKKDERDSDNCLLVIKPQPATLEMSQQGADNQLAKLNGIVAGSTGQGLDGNNGREVLGVVAAAGVAVFGLNAVNDPNNLPSANFNNDVDNIEKKMIATSRSFAEIAQVSPFSKRQYDRNFLPTVNIKTRVEIGEPKEQQHTKQIPKDELLSFQSKHSYQEKFERKQKEQGVRFLEQNDLRRQQERQEAKPEKKQQEQTQRDLDRQRPTEEEETARKGAGRGREEKEERQVELQNLLVERKRARLRLEAAEITKKKVEQKVAANEKAKVELKQRQEDLYSLRKQHRQKKESFPLRQPKQKEQNRLAKEKLEQQKVIEIINEEAKQAKVLAKELKEQLKVEEQYNIIQAGVNGIVIGGLTTAVGLVTSFEKQRRILMSIEESFNSSEYTNLSRENLFDVLGSEMTLKSSIRVAQKDTFATNITEKLQFMNEIDDLLAEVEDVLAEINNKTTESMPTRLSTETMSKYFLEFPAESTNTASKNMSGLSTQYFVDDKEVDHSEKTIIGESRFRSRLVSSDTTFLRKDTEDLEEVVEETRMKLEEYTRIQSEGEAWIEVGEEGKTNTVEATQLGAEEETNVMARIKKVEAAQLEVVEEARINKTKEVQMDVNNSSQLLKLETNEIQAKEGKYYKFEVEESIIQKEDSQLQLEKETEALSEVAQTQVEEVDCSETKENTKTIIEEIPQLKAKKQVQQQIEANRGKAKVTAVKIEEARRKPEEATRSQAVKNAPVEIEGDRIKAQEEARIKIDEAVRLQFEERTQINLELKMKEECILEKGRRKLLAEQLKGQKSSYKITLEERAMFARITVKELMITEQNQKKKIDKQTAMQVERKNHDALLYMVRRKMLHERMKERRLSFELSMGRKRAFRRKAEESTIRKMLAARLNIKKEDIDLASHAKDGEFEALLAGTEADMPNSGLKECTLQIKIASTSKGEEKEKAKAEKASIEEEEKARLKAEEAAKAEAEGEQAKLKAKEDAKAKAEACTKEEKMARFKAEEAAKAKAETGIKEAQSQLKAEEKAKFKAEEDRIKEVKHARLKADAAENVEAEEEARIKEDQMARSKAEEEAKAKAEEEARIMEVEQARPTAEEAAKATVEVEAHAKKEEEAQLKADDEFKAKADEALIKDVEEAKLKAEEAARVKAGGGARVLEEEQFQLKEEDSKAKAEEDHIEEAEQSRLKSEEKPTAEEVGLKADGKTNARAEKEGRIQGVENVGLRAEEEARFKIDEAVSFNLEEEVVTEVEGCNENEEIKVKEEDSSLVGAGKITEIIVEEAKIEKEACLETNMRTFDEEEKRVKVGIVLDANKVDTESKSEKREVESVPLSIEEISVEKYRLPELERVEIDFGLVDFISVSNENATEALAPEAENQIKDSLKVSSTLDRKDSSDALEKIKKKYELIEEQQSKITARIAQLEVLKGNVVKREIDVSEKNFLDGSQIVRRNRSPFEKAVPSQEQNSIDDEAMKLAHTITKNDDLYIPSKKALANTPLLMQEIVGSPLESYQSKAILISDKDVGVHAGNTLKIPVRITKPGSIVEFSIEKISYDFLFSISAFMDEGQVAIIKKMAPFVKRTDTQKIVVPAGNTPCTMQFAFFNNGSTLLESVRFSYEIRVIPPSAETTKLGRSRRTKSTLKFLKSELSSLREFLQTTKVSVVELDRDIEKLQEEISEKSFELKSIRIKQERLKKELGAGRGRTPTIFTIERDKYLNEL